MPRMRTAGKVLEIIQAEDPGTEVTLHYIRQLIKTGAVPSVAVGRKRLVDADDLIQRIAAGMVPAVSEGPKKEAVIPLGPKVRRVEI